MSYLFSVTSKPSEHYWEHQVGKACKCQAPACWNSTYNFLWMPSYQWPLLRCAYGSYCLISKPSTRKLPLLSRSWVAIIIITCFSNKGWFRLTICQLCWFTKKVPDHASPREHACWYLERGAASYSGGGRHQLGRISSANRIGSIWSMLHVLHSLYFYDVVAVKSVACSTVEEKQVREWRGEHILPIYWAVSKTGIKPYCSYDWLFFKHIDLLVFHSWSKADQRMKW